jgi:meso-butanediol dehydrogenase/(S,S)-butanediol dehydrogenase/diacetyl reductase
MGGAGRRLQGKAAIVTGAASGIGLDIAMAFHEQGAMVFLADISEQVEHVAMKLGERASAAVCDMSQAVQVEQMVQACAKEFGGLHVLANAAGIAGVGGALTTCTEDNFDRLMSVNAKSVFLSSRAAVPVLLASGGGAIVNIASVGAMIGFAMNASYCASKGAVLAFTRAHALECATMGIRVNAICPGFVDTPMTRAAAGDDVEATLAMQADMAPMKRMAVPSDIAQAAVYLASDESSYMTGSTLTVDGGYTAQ